MNKIVKSIIIGIPLLIILLVVVFIISLSGIGIYTSHHVSEGNKEGFRFNLEKNVLEQETSTYLGRHISGTFMAGGGHTERWIIFHRSINRISTTCTFHYESGNWSGPNDLIDHQIDLICKNETSTIKFSVIDDIDQNVTDDRYKKYYYEDTKFPELMWLIMSDILKYGYALPTKENIDVPTIRTA